MTWTRFNYICRRALLDIDQGAPAVDALAAAETETGSALYGKSPRSDALPRTLLERLAVLPSRDAATRALGIYGRLNVVELLSEPQQLKRVIVYLSYVVFVFYTVAAIYVLQVTPRFVELLGTFEAPLPASLLFFQKYWMTQVGVTSVLLLLCILSVLQIRQLFQFRNNAADGLAGRLLLAPGIRRSYGRVNDIMRFPVESAGGAVHEQLRSAESAGMDVVVESRALLQIELRELTRRCDRQQRVLSTIVAVAVLQAVVAFLSSAYAPIFVMGEVL